MRNSFRTNIEFGVQIITAIAVLVVAGVIVKRHVFTERRTPLNTSGIAVGEQLKLADVDWQQNKKSLVFFLNKDCQYCTSSAPAYRQLTEEAVNHNVKSLAVFPHSAEEAKAYLESINLSIDEIRTGPRSSYKIAGTPTVLFVNSSGTVEGVWVGDAFGRENQLREEFLTLAQKPVQ
jgi:thiol-disulfide isomerase/thioredoxin